MLGIFIAANPEVVSGDPGPLGWAVPLFCLALAALGVFSVRRSAKRLEAMREGKSKI